MRIVSRSPIYKCWASAKARGTFDGTIDDFVDTVGDYPGYGMELHRVSTDEPITKSNFKWVLPRPKDEAITECIKEGGSARPGSKCPYKMGDVGKRTAWLAGHYDSYGKKAWEKAGGGKAPRVGN